MVPLKHHLSNITTFSELKVLADHAKIGISFFGYSSIKVKGYKGAVHTDSLLKKFDDLIKTNKKNRIKISQGERKLYPEILKKVRVFYETDDVIYKRSNLITKIFWQVRNFFYSLKALRHGYTPRAQWELGVWENLENPPIPKPGIPPNQNTDIDAKTRIREIKKLLAKSEPTEVDDSDDESILQLSPEEVAAYEAAAKVKVPCGIEVFPKIDA